MIVNAMPRPAIPRPKKDGNALEAVLIGESPGFAALEWQSSLIATAVTLLCAGVTAWYTAGSWPMADDRWRLSIGIGLALSAALALLAWFAQAATPLGAVTGGILTATMVLAGIGAAIGSGDGKWFHTALLPLLALLLLTVWATRFGRSRKESLGLAQDARGRKAAQIAANLGVAGLAAAASVAISAARNLRFADPAFGLRGTRAPFKALWFVILGTVMLTAALAEATADTLSSELGEVFGGEPFLITTGARAAPGTDGAVSIAGTLAGIGGAVVVVLVAVPTLGLTFGAALAAAMGAVGGLFFDSLLGATAERNGRLNNDAVNFLSTLAAAILALALSLIFKTANHL